MKLCTLFAGLSLLSSLVLADTSTSILLPEVKKLMEVKPINDPQMAQNAYVYLMGIDAADDDYFAVSKKVIEHDNQIVRLYQYKKLELAMKVNDERDWYRYFCKDLYKRQCVQATLYKKNKILLARFNMLIKQQQINVQEIPAFLESLGDKAKNPYTLVPFTWDAKSATLST